MGFKPRVQRPNPLDAEDMIDLLEMYAADNRFRYARDGSVRLVAGDGPSRPKMLIVGDAPGAVDLQTQRPFQGRDGQVLRSLIKDVAGFADEDWWGTYLLKYRTDGRPPMLMESITAVEYIRAEMHLLGNPQLIITVGSLPWQAMGKPELGGLLHYAGKPMVSRWGGYLCPMLHPRYGLRHPELQDKIEEHWEGLALWMKEVGL